MRSLHYTRVNFAFPLFPKILHISFGAEVRCELHIKFITILKNRFVNYKRLITSVNLGTDQNPCLIKPACEF